MAGTEHIELIELGVGDAPAGLLLSTEAHWNQNEADWRFFLSRGIVFGVRDGKQLVATAALLPYSAGNAWISMVLVTASWRRRGVATRLVDACLNAATKLGLTTWLDATPDGANVYGPLGFTPTLQLRRLRLEAPKGVSAAQSLSTCSVADFIARDVNAMGFERGPLLTEFGGRAGSLMVSSGNAVALVRDGRTARHIGPVFAEAHDSALTLVDTIVRSEQGPWLLDAVHSQEDFLRGLTDTGWTIERPFQRMRFGRATMLAGELPFAVAGPEFG
ncbi:GNAT family N-acetyltransferase [Bradyrhizobium sp. AUGA SZCCT0431]|uniref:GNAT family N-acetyltransferase n=1 Tax=Bradyrhizobium sp. AUGA SZCCT0431 TaxID=2807674 RepID=UPI001BA4FB23|nr:GNAT family N-acetyltransferase [Bradyrhizobium sp. AUGA SZCCT0431]MBR1142938.1 GNAT family N-acetyltransferase [Bradyrhizobium sp. AUGA SZCCT0431]